jgi:plasmid stabilization system protein ParE
VSSPRIVLLDEARDDLRSLEAYIAEHDGEARAAAIRSKIDRAIRNLAAMPGMGGRRPYLNPKQRAFSVPPWIIYYETLLEKDGIRIVRIIDGRRDLPAIFRKAKRKAPDKK